jgi:hypothetical protein
MKQPDEPVIGGARKSLPTRKARKVNSTRPVKKSERKQNILDKNVEQELVKAFGEK